MTCVCKLELQAAVQAWLDLPLPSLTAKVPGFGLAAIYQASFGLMGAAGMSAQSSATAAASAGASASASAGASASAAVNAQALLGIYGALGIDPFSVDASAQMSLAIQSMNAHLPWVLGQLSAAFDAHFDALMTLNACLSASLVVEGLFGFGLGELGAGAKLEAAVSAMASAKATASASASASASAMASASASAQLGASAGGFGFDLSLPSGQADFAAALSAAANFSASLALPIGSLGLVASAVAQIKALAKIGIDLAAPDFELSLGLGLPSLFAGVQALLDLDLSAAASAQADASAQASATASADASASADLDLDLDLGLALPKLPDLGALSLAASLTAQLGLNGSLALGSPCSICPLQIQLVA